MQPFGLRAPYTTVSRYPVIKFLSGSTSTMLAYLKNGPSENSNIRRTLLRPGDTINPAAGCSIGTNRSREGSPFDRRNSPVKGEKPPKSTFWLWML